MRSFLKKAFSIFLAVVMLCTLLPNAVFAKDGSNEERLLDAVSDAVAPTNAVLNDRKYNKMTIALLSLDKATRDVNVEIKDPDFLAFNMLKVPFMEQLFAFDEIYSLQIGEEELTYENFTQFNLMLAVAQATLGKQMGLDRNECYVWLRENMDTLSLDCMDGTSCDIVINAMTDPAKQDLSTVYSLKFQLHFFISKHTVTWIFDNGTADLVRTYSYGDTILQPAPTKSGYRFFGWSQEVPETMGTTDLVFKAIWILNSQAAYTVRYYLMDTGGTTWQLAEEERKFGDIGATAAADVREYTGFVLSTLTPSTTQGTIIQDGTLILKVYYDRIKYVVTWDYGFTTRRLKTYYGAIPTPPANVTFPDGYVFSRWDKPLEPVTGDTTYKAVYVEDKEAAIGTTKYPTLKMALTAAVPGDTVRLLLDVSLEENLTVPAGVTLLIPCKDGDSGYVDHNGEPFNYDGETTDGNTGVGPDASCYRTLTIPEGKRLTVNGTILVNSVSGRPAAGHFDMDVTGGYGRIALDGDLTVGSGGTLDCFGYIAGSGTATAKDGAAVGDLYIIRNWRGGSQATAMYQNGVYPMNEADMPNITATLRIESGASYVGLVKMYGDGGYSAARFPLADKLGGLIRLTDGYLIRTQENGRTVYEMYGGADFASAVLDYFGKPLSTASFLYPIDGDTDFVLRDGAYEFVNDFKALTGVTVEVADDASLSVAKGATVIFYDEFNDVKNTSDTEYPVYDAALLTISEGAEFTNNGTFAGTIYTETADILSGEAPVWQAQSREAYGYYSENRVDPVSGDPGVITLQFGLTLTRLGYTWAFGDANEIVWTKTCNHDSTVLTGVIVPTCTEKGYSGDIVCTLCGKTITKGTEQKALGHDYINHAAQAPTCTEIGWDAYQTCSRCTYSTYVEKKALGHAYVNHAAQAPTCTEAGWDAYLTCSRCDYSSYKEREALGHDYVNHAAQAPTCTEAGWNAYQTCSRCDYSSYKEKEALGHDIVSDKAVAPTCTESGLTEGSHCTRCDAMTVAQETVEALGHDFVDGICSRCGEKDPNDKPIEPDKPCDGGKDCPSYRFTDVNYGDWYHEAVDFAVANGLFKGMSDTTFEPNTAMNRAMLVTVLWRYAGSPKEGTNTFTDVKNGQWYTDAIAWASSNGIVGGVGAGKFDPDGKVTREQLAAILYRYSNSEGFDTGKRGDLASFPDAGKVSSWAGDAYAWAVGEGLIGGNVIGGKAMLDPQGNATRAQVATILMRFIQNIADK